jgi:hypothetical protein
MMEKIPKLLLEESTTMNFEEEAGMEGWGKRKKTEKGYLIIF